MCAGFRSGEFNVLVATSIGEEGLDIGEVDLIICYDALGSATRTTQRYGRTGRKHDGKVVTLMTEGYEESIFDKVRRSCCTAAAALLLLHRCCCCTAAAAAAPRTLDEY